MNVMNHFHCLAASDVVHV